MPFDIYVASGMLGAAVLVAAYFANLQGWLAASDWRLPGANLFGSVLILVSLYNVWNLPSVVIECFWAAVSVYGLARIVRSRTGRS